LIDEENLDFRAQKPPQKKPNTLKSIDEIMENAREPDLDMESASQIVSFENQETIPIIDLTPMTSLIQA
jgi:hypothetical protein